MATTPPGAPLPFPGYGGGSPSSLASVPSPCATPPSLAAPVGVAEANPASGAVDLHLPFDMGVSVSPCGAVLLINKPFGSSVALSGSGMEMGFEHPVARVLQYMDNIQGSALNKLICLAK